MNLNKEFFFELERRLKKAGLDSDAESFDVIKERLSRPAQLSPDDFAAQAIYVILAGGFSQKTAKTKHAEIIKYIKKAGKLANLDDLLQLFNNRNKMSAVLRIWQNREKYRDGYYAIDRVIPGREANPESGKDQGVENISNCENFAIPSPFQIPDNAPAAHFRDDTLNKKLSYLSTLPHIGRITAGHFARNLGENVVKYDIWIQRLGVAFAGRDDLKPKIDNGKLDSDIKTVCDEMFSHLEYETGLPRGYIDVVLFRACQNHMIEGV